MKIIEAKDITSRILDLWKTGNEPGKSVGFKTIDQYYTCKPGQTTYITGYPFSGKTQLTFQILVNLTSLYSWRHVIYSPETGTPEEVYAEIIFCLTGKTFNKQFSNYISENELYTVMPFVQEYFKVIQPNEADGLTLDQWFKTVETVSKSVRIHTALIDNWNDLEHDMTKHGNKISEYLKFQLPRFNRFCKASDIHGFILAHPRSPDMRGKKELDPPRPDEMEGGSLWWAKAQTIMVVHRLMDSEDKRTTVIFKKIKPKIIGRVGMVKLHYAAAYNCYFEEVGSEFHYPQTPFKTNGKPSGIEIQLPEKQEKIELSEEVPF